MLTIIINRLWFNIKNFFFILFLCVLRFFFYSPFFFKMIWYTNINLSNEKHLTPSIIEALPERI
jgi:hypothetical protein